MTYYDMIRCDMSYCDVFRLLVNGNWTEWTEWSAGCSLHCIKYRTRNCTEPAPQYFGDDCEGEGNETKRCWAAPCNRKYLEYDLQSIVVNSNMWFWYNCLSYKSA